MVARLLVYGVLVGGAFYLERQFAVLSELRFANLIFYGPLFVAYMLLLYLEVRSNVRRGGTQTRIQWAGGGFTAGVGLIWGLVISTHRGTLPMLEGPVQFLGYLFGLIVFSAMWGVLGAALSLLILKFVFRKEVS